MPGSGHHGSLLHNHTRDFGKAHEFVVPQVLLISGIFIHLILFFLVFLLVIMTAVIVCVSCHEASLPLLKLGQPH